ncbi:MAG: hypothetical protein IPH28_00265 [Cytophagaceae bacterium]|nr:hypothetical protein [Cytophagaceae bacterium]
MNRLSSEFFNTFFKSQAQVASFAYLSDPEYRTPGGLTLAQKDQNPKEPDQHATLREQTFQKAGIFAKIGFAGIADQYNFEMDLLLKISHFTYQSSDKNPSYYQF